MAPSCLQNPFIRFWRKLEPLGSLGPFQNWVGTFLWCLGPFEHWFGIFGIFQYWFGTFSGMFGTFSALIWDLLGSFLGSFANKARQASRHNYESSGVRNMSRIFEPRFKDYCMFFLKIRQASRHNYESSGVRNMGRIFGPRFKN